jgi:hypothetical protein
VADSKGLVFNNLQDQNHVLKIDSRKMAIEGRCPTAPCQSPSSMAMDKTNRRLFIGCRSRVMAVMNADAGLVIATLPIGEHVDATVFDTESRLVFNSNGEGTIYSDPSGGAGQVLGIANGGDDAAGKDYGARSQNAQAVPVHGRGRGSLRSWLWRKQTDPGFVG